MQTKTYVGILDQIEHANNALQKEHVKKVLIFYDEKVLFIGDTCIKFGMLSLFKAFFPNAAIDINCRNSKYTDSYEALLQYNPFVNKRMGTDWKHISLNDYDVVLVISFEEEILLNLLEQNYQSLANGYPWNTAFFSMSNLGLNLTTRKVNVFFPEYHELMAFAQAYPHRPQLFISDEERQWGTAWLEAHGVQPNDRVYIISDGCSSDSKLATTETYCELITYLAEMEGARILIYDEKAAGKESFYAERLSMSTLSRMIFAKALGLRRDLRILASPYTKLVLGPCTGLLHCASGIYNEFVKNELPAQSIPRLVTYTGTYEGKDNHAQLWWGSSPLVHCLQLKEKNGKKEIVVLHELDDTEKVNKEHLLPCSEYTPELLINYLKKIL